MADWFPCLGICSGGICWLFFIIIWIALAVCVYKDAERRGDDNAAIWLIVNILVPIIGLIIYLVVRKERQPQQYYQQPYPQQPYAQPQPQPTQQVYNCTGCGAALRYIQQYQRWYCDHCGKYV